MKRYSCRGLNRNTASDQGNMASCPWSYWTNRPVSFIIRVWRRNSGRPFSTLGTNSFFIRLSGLCRQMLISLVFFGSLAERMIHFIHKRESLSVLCQITGFYSGLSIWVRGLLGWSESGKYLLEEKFRFQRLRRRH